MVFSFIEDCVSLAAVILFIAAIALWSDLLMQL